MQDVYVLIS